MTIETGKRLLNHFHKAAKLHKDAYLTVHFSREDNQFNGQDYGMDMYDAIIIIEELAKKFNLKPEALAQMRLTETEKQ